MKTRRIVVKMNSFVIFLKNSRLDNLLLKLTELQWIFFTIICHCTGNFSTRHFHEKGATVWRLGSNTAGLLINEPKPTFACLMNEHGKRVSEFPSQSETLKLQSFYYSKQAALLCTLASCTFHKSTLEMSTIEDKVMRVGSFNFCYLYWKYLIKWTTLNDYKH